MRKQNKTIIKADRIEHVDVAKVHNPRTRRNAAGKADILQQGVKAGILPAGLVTDLQRLEEGRFPADPARRANLLQRATKLRNDLVYQNLLEENLLGEAVQRALYDVIARQQRKSVRSNPRRGTRWFGGKAGLTSSARAFGSPRAMELRDLIERGVDTPQEYMEFYQLFDRLSKQSKRQKGKRKGVIPRAFGARARRNAESKDSEHPIEVTRHFRGGPPGYLSPWQKAMAIGQQELFDTGIKLAPRAAELRARLSNPGATKPVYQSGLKQATAGQLPRLARVGLRVGRTPAEIRSDLATTGRFSAEQIRRAIDQATTAERRENPPLTDEQLRRIPKKPPATRAKYQQMLKEYPAKVALLRELVTAHHFFVPAGKGKPTRATMSAAKKAATQYFRNELFDIVKSMPLRKFVDILDEELSNYDKYYRNRRGSSAWEWYPLEWREYWKKKNPPVGEIFETFNGRPATRATSVQAPRRTPGRVAQLGRLRLIRTADGRTWRFPGERAPFLAADSRGKLHVVGGQYRANPAGEECGEIEQIEYQTSKPHLGHANETIYYHQLGEETGERPLLEITPEGELQIVGGDYRIEADGIHN